MSTNAEGIALLMPAMAKDTGVYPGDGTVGREMPEWFAAAQIAIASGTIQISDLGQASGIEVDVPKGLYSAEVRLIDFGGSLRISRLRVRLDGSTVICCEKLGEISVDLAAVAVADMQDIRKDLTEAEMQEFGQIAIKFMGVFCDLCQLNFESRTIQFLTCKSGLGDGAYPVFALRSRDDLLGFEAVFVQDGHVLNMHRSIT